MNKKSGLKSDVKRKLVTGTIEAVIGLGILIYSWVTGASLYLYAGGLFAASGAFTLVICVLRIINDKKMAEKEKVAEEKQNSLSAENTNQAEQTQMEQAQAEQTQVEKPSQDSNDSEM